MLQHAIGEPPLQRRGVELLRQAVAAGEAAAWQAAYLEDRVRFFEGRPQVYGTQYEWGEDGQLGPYPVEDMEDVDERRRSVGLWPLAENTRRMREDTTRSGGGPPEDLDGWRRKMEEWARSVGWREERPLSRYAPSPSPE